MSKMNRLMSKVDKKEVTPNEFYGWLRRMVDKASSVDLPEEVLNRELTTEQKDAIKTIEFMLLNDLDLDYETSNGIKRFLVNRKLHILDF